MVEVPLVAVDLPTVRSAARSVALVAVGACGAALAWYGATLVRLPVTSDWGLVALLPPVFWVGLAVLNTAIGLVLSERRPSFGLTAVLMTLLVVVVYGTPAAMSPYPRLEVSWRHLGIADTVLHTGQVDPHIDAYFNWPGFFAGLASLLDASGVSGRSVALVAPVVNGLLWSVAVAALVRTLTRSAHHVWLAVWLFTLADWIDQDYLSPQALAFFLHLVAVALLFRYLDARATVPLRSALEEDGVRAGARRWWRSRLPVEVDARRRVAALLLVVLLAAVIVPVHQLTPFMLLATVAVLTALGRLWAPGLLTVLGLVVALWLVTAASTYLAGHPVLFQQGTTDTVVAQRTDGSPGHVAVVQIRSMLTALVYGLAMLGAWRLVRARRLDLRPVVLMLMPFVMVPVQSYGGEMIMRATLFGLPFAAYLAAALFLRPEPADTPRDRLARPSATGATALRAVPVVAVALVMSVAVVTGRYGNSAFDMFTDAEVQGVQALYRLAPPGSTLVAGAHSTPWKYRDYTTYRYTSLVNLCPTPIRVRSCYPLLRDLAHSKGSRTFLIITRAEREALRIQGDATLATVDRLERAATRSGAARVVYSNTEVEVYAFRPGR